MNPAPSTRAAAQQHWQQYLPRAGGYADRRNQVEPGHPWVSRLSPALRCRLVLEEEVLASLTQSYPFPAVEKLVQEVLWRTYWKGWLEQRPAVWTDYLAWQIRQGPGLPAATLATMQNVAAGRSGIAFMDALVAELKTTGYLHNHARMWFAAFWIHQQKLPWQAGADFFYRHLLDADAASNTLSWRWVAGLQTPGKTYLVRRSNVERWTSPALLQPDTGLDLLADAAAAPAMVPVSPNPPPGPLANDPETGAVTGAHAVWLHWDDLALEHSGLAQSPAPAAVIAVWPQAWVKDWSPLKQQHFRTALRDGLDRAAAAFGCPAHWLEAEEPAVALTDWLKQNDFSQLLAMRPFTGDWSPMVPALEASGIAVHWRRRGWDRQWFPAAGKGFFGFWETARPILAGRFPRGR